MFCIVLFCLPLVLLSLAMSYTVRPKEESETRLEYLLDTLQGFPLPLKRQLDHIGALTDMGDEKGERLRAREQAFLDGARERIREFPWVEGTTSAELLAAIGQEDELRAIREEQKAVADLLNERCEVSELICRDVDDQVDRIDAMLRAFEARLREEGVFSQICAQAGDQVAIQLDPSKQDWVLGKVTGFNPETSIYKIQDEDGDNGSKHYTLPQAQVMQLGLHTNLSKGETIMAIYPDTTSFYAATVVTMRKVAGGTVVYVLFQDDKDDMGVTHEKPVLLSQIMKL